MGQSKEQLQKKYHDCSELHEQWYIDYNSTNGKTDRRHKNLCNDEMESLRIEMRLLEKELSMIDKITELEKRLENYLKLQKEVQLGIERVWSIDSYDYSTYPYDVKERSEIIEQVFYKIGKKWID